MHNWNRERWNWKRSVRMDVRVSDAAKLLATALCDDWAHHETAFCNPEIGTMARALGKSDRSIQRAIKELIKAGWIAVKYARGRGRSSEISFEKGDGTVAYDSGEKVTTMSSNGSEKVTTVAIKGDNRVTPYNEPKNIQKSGQVQNICQSVAGRFKDIRFSGAATSGLRNVPISDFNSLNKWAEWLLGERYPRLEQMPISRKDEKTGRVFFLLPGLVPPTTPEATKQVRQFFETIVDKEAVHHAAQ